MTNKLNPLYGYLIWGFPPSNYSIRLKYDQLDIKHLKKQISELSESINVKEIDLFSDRYDQSRADVKGIVHLNIIFSYMKFNKIVI